MAKKKLDFGGNVNPQYINPIQSNTNIGKLQTTLPNQGMMGNLTKNGQLDIKTPETPASRGFLKNMDAGSAIGGVAGLAGLAAPLVGDNAVGDALGGVGSGVAAGAALGPIGMAGGAVVGGLTSIIGGNKRRRKARKAKAEQSYKSMAADAQQRSSQMVDNTPDVAVMKSGGWIQKAINPAHKGYCTPLSKPSCTGHRRALALRFKKGGDLHKDSRAYGGTLMEYGGSTHEQSPVGGNPVDANGNITTPDNAVALTEKNEVAWNKGKNDTYVFSDRLGFAKEAKSIMKKYEKRLGKDLDGSDNISKSSMNRELTKLQNTQEAIKDELGLNEDTQMANGGTVPKEPMAPKSPIDTYKWQDEVNKEAFGKFKERFEQDEYSKERARLFSYKQKLDKALKQTNPKGFDEFQKAKPGKVKENIAAADAAYKTKSFTNYLDVPDIQTHLGEDYGDYVNLMTKHNAALYGIKGQKESSKDVPDLKYGLRTSEILQPFRYESRVKDVVDKKQDAASFTGRILYDPTTKQYQYSYDTPKEYRVIRKGELDTMAYGGNIKKMDTGGKIPKLDNTLNVDMTGIPVRGMKLSDVPYSTPIQRGKETRIPNATSMKKPVATKTNEVEKTYLGDIAPIAGSTALSMAGTAYALSKLKKPKPTQFTRITPSTISLESARESARTSAKEGLATIRSAAKGVGSPNYMNEVIAGTVGTQRELGKNLTQSYIAEQTANAAAKDEAARANLSAELSAAGIDASRLDKYQDTKAALTSNLFTLPAMGVSEYLGNKQVLDAAQLGSRYKLVTDPKSRFRRKTKLNPEQ